MHAAALPIRILAILALVVLVAPAAAADPVLAGDAVGATVADPGSEPVVVPLPGLVAPAPCQLEPHCHAGFDTPAVVVPLSLIPAGPTPPLAPIPLVPAACNAAVVVQVCNPALGVPGVASFPVGPFGDIGLVPGLTWLPMCSWASNAPALLCTDREIVAEGDRTILGQRPPLALLPPVSFELRYSDFVVDHELGPLEFEHVQDVVVTAAGFEVTLCPGPQGCDIPKAPSAAAAGSVTLTLVVAVGSSRTEVPVPIAV